MKNILFALISAFTLLGCSSTGIVWEDPKLRWGQPPTSQEMVGHIYTRADHDKQEIPLG